MVMDMNFGRVFLCIDYTLIALGDFIMKMAGGLGLFLLSLLKQACISLFYGLFHGIQQLGTFLFSTSLVINDQQLGGHDARDRLIGELRYQLAQEQILRQLMFA